MKKISLLIIILLYNNLSICYNDTNKKHEELNKKLDELNKKQYNHDHILYLNTEFNKFKIETIEAFNHIENFNQDVIKNFNKLANNNSFNYKILDTILTGIISYYATSIGLYTWQNYITNPLFYPAWMRKYLFNNFF
jgi:hypothetical protein